MSVSSATSQCRCEKIHVIQVLELKESDVRNFEVSVSGCDPRFKDPTPIPDSIKHAIWNRSILPGHTRVETGNSVRSVGVRGCNVHFPNNLRSGCLRDLLNL